MYCTDWFFQYTLWFIVQIIIARASQFSNFDWGTSVPITDIFSLPENGSFVDNIALLDDRTLLLTRIDAPEVWSVDLPTRSGRLVHSFAENNNQLTSCFGITKTGHHTFTVVVGQFDVAKFSPEKGSFGIWKVQLGLSINHDAPEERTRRHEAQFAGKNIAFSSQPVVSNFANIFEASALGASTLLETATSRFLLISDSLDGIIWKLDLETGEYDIALQDDSMLPPPDGPPMGVNGIKVHNGYLYYVSVGRKEFRRVRIDTAANAIGPFELVSADITPDNFDIASDGTAYFATNTENSIVSLTPEGEVIQIAGDKNSTRLAGPTCCALDPDGRTLYIGTNGGMMAPVGGVFEEPGKIAAISV
ncbi:hypothetical protein BDV59DRAFT_186122 [Aspergillus ambiguus]|uniref:uncharacterized protein n=1 Tax=Aspergillus ambiguus TaxID=176160 RepID=UPI003CCD419F